MNAMPSNGVGLCMGKGIAIIVQCASAFSNDGWTSWLIIPLIVSSY